MNKKTIVFLLVVTFASLSAAVFQYFKTFQADLVSAADASKPVNGHLWSDMLCGGGLCVKSDKVEVGTNTSKADLSVSGNMTTSGKIDATGNVTSSGTVTATGVSSSGTITATGNITSNGAITAGSLKSNGTITATGNITSGGDICNKDGLCLKGIVGSLNIAGGTDHDRSACESALSVDGKTYGKLIYQTGLSYPICRFEGSSCPSGWKPYDSWTTTVTNSCSGCSSVSVGGHAWGNIARESQGYSSKTNHGGMYSCDWSTCYSSITQIGCF